MNDGQRALLNDREPRPKMTCGVRQMRGYAVWHDARSVMNGSAGHRTISAAVSQPPTRPEWKLAIHQSSTNRDFDQFTFLCCRGRNDAYKTFGSHQR